MKQKTLAPLPANLVQDNFALLCFVAEGNLQKVAAALASKQTLVLEQAGERNKKIQKLQHEVEEAALDQLQEPQLSKRDRRFLLMVSHLARMIVRFGEDTVRIAATARQMLETDSTPSLEQTHKILCQVTYMTDLGMVGLLQGRGDKCLAALESQQIAENLLVQVARSCPPVNLTKAGANLTSQLFTCTRSLIIQATEMVLEIKDYLEVAEDPTAIQTRP